MKRRAWIIALCGGLITGCETMSESEAEAELQERVYNPRTKTYMTTPAPAAPGAPRGQTLQTGRLIR